MSENRCQFIGRLTADLQLRYTTGPEPTAVCEFSLAVDRPKKKDGKDGGADFIRCVAFGSRAETMNRYLGKGRKIYIAGPLRVEPYEDKETGKKRSSTKVVVDKFEFCDSRPQYSTDTYAPEQQRTAAAAPTMKQTTIEETQYRPIDQSIEGDDDLPF